MGGGTGILWNLLTSHPDCLGPRYETNEIFFFGALNFAKAVAKHRPSQIQNMLRLTQFSLRYRFNPCLFKAFDMFDLSTRDPHELDNRNFIRAVDQRLYELKIDHALHPFLDKEDHRTRRSKYTLQEIRNTRLVAKNLEGLCFLYPFFSRIYPEARFISIVRNGLANCESKLRKKRAASALEAGVVYRTLVTQMLKLSKQRNCLLIRYEDLIESPQDTIAKIYEFLDLEVDTTQEFRMSVREFLGKETTLLRNKPPKKGKLWFSMDELMGQFLQRDINARGVARLSPEQRITFTKECLHILQNLDYA